MPATIPADTPCPAWCELAPGHPFDSYLTDPGTLYRSHEHTYGTGRECVTLLIGETALTPAGPVDPDCEPAVITVEQAELTAAAARALAANLLAAAEALSMLDTPTGA